MTAITAPGLRYVFEARVDIAPTKQVGQAGSAPLGFVPITGGTVTGPRLNGSIEPGGGDWAISRTGYAVDLDAGESVDPSAYYFRSQPVFRTDAPQHTWLTHTVFVGVAYDDNQSSQIRIQFFEVL